MNGILVVAHGSREKNTLKTFEGVVELVRKKLPDTVIEGAYMEFCDVNIEKGLDALVAKGVTSVKVVPYFLFDGIHIKEDIPNEIKEYAEKRPGVEIALCRAFGVDERLADIVADRIKE